MVVFDSYDGIYMKIENIENYSILRMKFASIKILLLKQCGEKKIRFIHMMQMVDILKIEKRL
jgi:hypothetical protein